MQGVLGFYSIEIRRNENGGSAKGRRIPLDTKYGNWDGRRGKGKKMGRIGTGACGERWPSL